MSILSSRTNDISTEKKFVEHVLIPVFDTKKVDDHGDKNQTHLEEVDKIPRVKQPAILDMATEKKFVRNATLTLLKKLESDGIIEVKRGRGGGYSLNYTTKELLEQVKNKGTDPKTSKRVYVMYRRIH